MNNIKTNFSIKDLEHLSGVKAHTIRIWEKRYNLFQPKRTDTNIRFYSLESLQKLLNVTFLYNHGYKISKIAKIDKDEIATIVREMAINDNTDEQAMNAFKLSMLNFDKVLFLNTYENLLNEKPFSDIFYEIFIPLMNDIGLLWQTNTITPAQEHFISELILQKTLVNTEKLQKKEHKNDSKAFVLYLPENEIHDLGLHFLNYELVSQEYHTIYLGTTVPIKSLTDVLKHYKRLIFISYFTIKPERDQIDSYLTKFFETILKENNHELWVLGRMTEFINENSLPPRIKIFNSIKNLVKEV
jgi:DNA-binding transcriptional MerR regulator